MTDDVTLDFPEALPPKPRSPKDPKSCQPIRRLVETPTECLPL